MPFFNVDPAIAMIEVTVVLLEGALPSTFIAPVEIFSGAGVLWNILRKEPPEPYFRVRTASITGGLTRTSVPAAIKPEGSIHRVRSTDLIIVAAVGADLAESCRRNAAVIPWLRQWHRRGAAIAGVCSGVCLMAEAGLLDARPATTHWGLVDACRARYPRVRWQPERFITESGTLFCSGGVYGSIDLSLYLVERYCGHDAALRTAKSLLLETPRTWQPGYSVNAPGSSHGDEPIRNAQEWLFKEFRQELRVEELAARVGMSPRNFARRFKAATGDSPLMYLHRIRIQAARHLLEKESVSIQEISLAVGYEDLAFFRRLFKRYSGTAPRHYRDRFRCSIAARQPLKPRKAR
jgi:transcriptional regulator GlxA family with amidase domain